MPVAITDTDRLTERVEQIADALTIADDHRVRAESWVTDAKTEADQSYDDTEDWNAGEARDSAEVAIGELGELSGALGDANYALTQLREEIEEAAR